MRHCAAVLVAADVAHPRQAAGYAVAAGHFFGAQGHRLDVGPGFHGVGKGGAAEGLPVDMGFNHVAAIDGGVFRLVEIKATGVVRPGHETGGAAHAAHGTHGVNRQIKAQTLRAHVRRQRAHGTEFAHDVERVIAQVDIVGFRGEVFAGDGFYRLQHLAVVGPFRHEQFGRMLQECLAQGGHGACLSVHVFKVFLNKAGWNGLYSKRFWGFQTAC